EAWPSAFYVGGDPLGDGGAGGLVDGGGHGFHDGGCCGGGVSGGGGGPPVVGVCRLGSCAGGSSRGGGGGGRGRGLGCSVVGGRSRCSRCWLPGWSPRPDDAAWWACSPGRGWPPRSRSTRRVGSSRMRSGTSTSWGWRWRG